MKALIVVDEEDIGLMVRIILTNAGVPADYVSRVNTARTEIRKNNYDLFVLDLNLPDGTGFDLIPLIRDYHPGAEIVIVSAYDGSVEKHKAEEFGVRSFIKKPFTKQDLQNVVKSLIEK